MKKLSLLLFFSVLLAGCKKQGNGPDINTQLTGTWKSVTIIDVVFDSKTKKEINRYNYLHGINTLITFDGKGGTIAQDTSTNTKFNDMYTLRTDNTHHYLTTHLANIDRTVEYEILSLQGNQLQLKGTVITDFAFLQTDGKYYNVYYERTEYFEKK